jgi:hypothetical protein
MITIKAGFRSATPQVSHRLHRRFQSFSEIIGIHGWHKFKLGTKPYEQWFGYDRYLPNPSCRKKSASDTVLCNKIGSLRLQFADRVREKLAKRPVLDRAIT